jgi:hypothetical protein
MIVSHASPVARLYLESEKTWQSFLNANFPGSRRLLRWGQGHRVYRVGNRVLKIEFASLGARDHSRSIHFEFEMLELMEGRACHFNPTYRIIDDFWCVLEIDWIDGEYLDNLIRQGRGRQASITKLLRTLFRISMAGIVYKQLRARHVIRQTDGELAVIDFGISRKTHPLRALWENLVPVTFAGGRLTPTRSLSIIVEMRRRRPPAKAERSHAVAAGVNRWSVNPTRPPEGKPPHLARNPGDPHAAEQLGLMEDCLRDAVSANPAVAADLNEVHFAEYGLGAPRDWGFIWDYIANRVDFTGKSVVDLGSGMGAVGVFAALGGARSIVGLDDDSNLIQAAEHFSAGLQIETTRHVQVDRLAQTATLDKLPAGNILTVLSTRTEDLPRESLLARMADFDEILWQTPAPERAVADLHAHGFEAVDVLVDGALGRKIIYAAKRNTKGTMQ